jgi:alpha-L-rhamnosidase
MSMAPIQRPRSRLGVGGIGKDWTSATKVANGWETGAQTGVDWRPVQSTGSIESTVELFQWNADAGMYDWPGYDGISGYLAHMNIPARGLLAGYAGRGRFSNAEALTAAETAEAGEFGVRLPSAVLTDARRRACFSILVESLQGA